MINFDDYRFDLDLVAKLPKNYPGDRMTILQGYLLQFLPLASIQLDRIKSGIGRLHEEKGMGVPLTLIEVFGDVRFYYETLYWIGFSVEKQANANPKSAFGQHYKKHKMQLLIEKLKRGRVVLNHIHFDQLITAEAKQDFARINKHLPGDKLLFKINVLKDGKGIKIAKETLHFQDDYNRLDELRTLLI